MTSSFQIPSDPVHRMAWEGCAHPPSTWPDKDSVLDRYEEDQKDELFQTAENWLNVITGQAIVKGVIFLCVHQVSYTGWLLLAAFWYSGTVLGDIGINSMSRLPLKLFMVYCAICILLGVAMGAYLLYLHYIMYYELKIVETTRDGWGGIQEHFPKGCSNDSSWFHIRIDDWYGYLRFFGGLVVSVAFCLGLETSLHAYAICWMCYLMEGWHEEESTMHYRFADKYDEC
eukprot:2328551-Amphidinium_carterae.1